jgi:hypothetical protein
LSCIFFIEQNQQQNSAATKQDADLLPCSLALIRTIQFTTTNKQFCMLFDSGLDNTFIHQKAIKFGASPWVNNPRQGQMLTGLLQISQEVDLQEIYCPNLADPVALTVNKLSFLQANATMTSFLVVIFYETIGMKHNFDTGDMTAFDITIEMKQKSFYSNPFTALTKIQDDECFHSTQILQSKYSKADITKAAKQQTHLTTEQQAELQVVLGKHTKLFPGKLGHYRHKKMHLELLPVHAKPYPIPCTQHEVFQKELQQLVQLGVLSQVRGTKWASPSFIIPKKYQTICWISNF